MASEPDAGRSTRDDRRGLYAIGKGGRYSIGRVQARGEGGRSSMDRRKEAVSD